MPLLRKKVRCGDSIDRLEEATWWKDQQAFSSFVTTSGEENESENMFMQSKETSQLDFKPRSKKHWIKSSTFQKATN